MRIRRGAGATLITAAVLAAATTAASGVSNVPAGTAQLTVTANSSTDTVTHLFDAGGISGRLTRAGSTAAAAGQPLVFVNTATHRAYGNVRSKPNGDYYIGGLPAGDYDVCVHSAGVPGSTNAPYGFVPRCRGSARWLTSTRDTAVTRGATAVHVFDGIMLTGVDVALKAGSAVSGRVAQRWDARPVTRGRVVVYQAGRRVAAGPVGNDGRYRVQSIPSARGSSAYRVCFVDDLGYFSRPGLGWSPQCWRSSTWDGLSAPPRTAGAVQVASGRAARRNFTVRRGAAIAGLVRSAGSAHTWINSTSVTLWRGRHLVEQVYSSRGAYRFTSLAAASNYVVCAAHGTVARQSQAKVGSRCWRDAPYQGFGRPSSATTSIAVRTAHARTGVNLLLPVQRFPVGSVSGRVTGFGNPVQSVIAVVYDAHGTPLGDAFTNTHGFYEIRGIRASAAGYQVCFDTHVVDAAGFGYADQCYPQVPWVGGQTPRPAGAFDVPVTAGSTTTGVNASLTAGGQLSGVVHSDSTGAKLEGVQVLVLDRANRIVRGAMTDGTGYWRVGGITPKNDYYKECFIGDATVLPSTTPPTGFLNECYADLVWTGH